MNGGRLWQMVADVAEVRTELRRQGASQKAIDEATERIVRDAWEPIVVNERFWPERYMLAVCALCDGTGLIMHRNVKNRLGLIVDEGSPCRCPKGAKFEPKPPSESDHTQAGKTPKAKPMSRFGR